MRKSERGVYKMFEKVWRCFGDVRIPAIVVDDPIVKFGKNDELVEIFLLIDNFCLLRVVPLSVLEIAVDGDGWRTDWLPDFDKLHELN